MRSGRQRNVTVLANSPHPTVLLWKLRVTLTGHELRGEGRVYGGGLNKIEPSELGRISAKRFLELWPELAESVQRVETASLFG